MPEKFDALTKTSEFRLKLYPKKYYECREFYKKALKFPIVNEWDRSSKDKGVMFDTGAGIIELMRKGMPRKSGCDISLEVKDVWKLYGKMKKKSKIVFNLRNNAWGDTSFRLSDPEGFEITFFTKTR